MNLGNSAPWMLLGLLLFPFIRPAAAADAKMNIYLENDGDETVNVAYAYHTWKGLLWGNDGWGPVTVKGWYPLKPNARMFLATVDEYDVVSVAFMKRGGYVVYQPKQNNLNFKYDWLSVDPNHAFDYQGSAPDGFVRIKKSFSTKLRASGAGELNSTISIPSFKSDHVTSPGSKAVAPPAPAEPAAANHNSSPWELLAEGLATKDMGPGQIAGRFLRAVYDGDMAKARLLGDATTKASIDNLPEVLRQRREGVVITILGEEIHGTNAVVTWQKNDGDPVRLQLVRTSGGRWEVHDDLSKTK